MKIPSDCEFLFKETGAKRWLARPRGPRPNAVAPLTYEENPIPSTSTYLYSTDKRCLHLTESLMTKLNKEFPTDVLPSGFAGPTGVPGDFNALLNVSGCGMDPLPIPVSDNADFIKANSCLDKIRSQDEPWLKELIRLFFGHVAPANLHIRKQASTGFPYFTSDVQYKKLATLKALWNADDVLNMVCGDTGGLKSALAEYHMIFLYAIQERQQPNAIIFKDGKYSSKGRTAPTEVEARSGSYAGKTVADMAVRDERGMIIPGHFAMRRRDVFGLNGVINYFLTAFFGCFREVYTHRFAATFKTRGRLDKQARIEKYTYVVGCDVKTMDKMIPKWFMTFFFSELTKYLDDRVVEMMRRAFQAPYVVPSPWVKTSPDYNPVFGGSPLDPENLKQHVGLPSGIAFNPDYGKLWMVFVYAVLYRDVGALKDPSELEMFLRGMNPQHALQDMSDDAAFLTNSAVVAEKLKKATSPYAVLEPETPVIFLGDVYCESAGKKVVYPNPITYVVNSLCREDSIDRKPISAWAEGVLARSHVYSPSPIYRDMNAIYEEEFRKHVGVNPFLIAKSLAHNQRFTDIDAMVRANPHVLHYKVDPKDVSPEVLDELISTIPAADFFNKIKHLFKVPTVPLEEI